MYSELVGDGVARLGDRDEDEAEAVSVKPPGMYPGSCVFVCGGSCNVRHMSSPVVRVERVPGPYETEGGV